MTISYVYYPLKIADFSFNRDWNSGRSLCLFFLDQYQSFDIFMSLFKSNKDNDNVIWLLDVSSLTFTLDQLLIQLSETALDLDDDLFLVNNSRGSIKMTEAYRISPTMPVTLLDYDASMSRIDKWTRRRNLQGVHIRTQTLPGYPYIADLEPLKDNPGYFAASGLFFDIVDDLKVIIGTWDCNDCSHQCH